MASPLLSGFAQSDGGRWCSHLAACPAQTRCCRPHFDVPSLCVPSPRSVSAAEPNRRQRVWDSVKPVRRQERSFRLAGWKEKRGKRRDAAWVCQVPLKKTNHLCDHGRAAGEQLRDENRLTP